MSWRSIRMCIALSPCWPPCAPLMTRGLWALEISAIYYDKTNAAVRPRRRRYMNGSILLCRLRRQQAGARCLCGPQGALSPVAAATSPSGMTGRSRTATAWSGRRRASVPGLPTGSPSSAPRAGMWPRFRNGSQGARRVARNAVKWDRFPRLPCRFPPPARGDVDLDDLAEDFAENLAMDAEVERLRSHAAHGAEEDADLDVAVIDKHAANGSAPGGERGDSASCLQRLLAGARCDILQSRPCACPGSGGWRPGRSIPTCCRWRLAATVLRRPRLCAAEAGFRLPLPGPKG